MINFKSFLTEQEDKPAEGQKLKHLTHLEDNVIHGGHEGVGVAAQHLDDVHDTLLGKNNSTHVSTKYDGSPSIVFGQHPQTGQFFVASKSAFNKTPKINYTPEDIDTNHGHAPGLSQKLKDALVHLPKIMPRNGGVYQGDLMYSKPDVEKNKGQYNFTPNAITYSTPQDSPQGKAIKNAELGVVVHTQYGGSKDLAGMSASPLKNKQRDKFERHPDVHNIDPTIKSNPSNYTPEEQREFLNHKEAAKQTYAKMKPEAMDALAGHGTALEGHINQMVRTGGIPSTEGYMDHLTNKHLKDVEKVKTQAAKDKKIQAHAAVMKHIMDNKHHFDKTLELHGHLQKAKDVLTNVMAKNSEFGHSINGQPTGPEGAVAVDKNGNMSKFVDRAEFSRQNLLGAGRFQKQPVNESFLAEGIMPTHVTTFMRANPPTAGHEKVVNKVLDVAKDTGGSHNVVLSHSQDPAKNPLPANVKLKHAKRAFPNANVETSDEEHPSLLHQATKLSQQGVKNLHLVVGQDRVGQFHNLLNKYNGVESKHGLYNFDNIHVHSAGDRDPDAEGVEGVSGTMMRKAAKEGNRTLFHTGTSSSMSEKHKDDMMKDIQKHMEIKEDYDDDNEEFRRKNMNTPDTPFTSAIKQYTPLGTIGDIGNAANKGDIGGVLKGAAKLGTTAIRGPAGAIAGAAVDALTSNDNRPQPTEKPKKQLKTFKEASGYVPNEGNAASMAELGARGAPTESGPKKKKSIKENATPAVGGLGFNTGNPAASGSYIANYVDGNTADADTRDNILKSMIKTNHDKLHAPLGFKAFNPKEYRKTK